MALGDEARVDVRIRREADVIVIGVAERRLADRQVRVVLAGLDRDVEVVGLERRGVVEVQHTDPDGEVSRTPAEVVVTQRRDVAAGKSLAHVLVVQVAEQLQAE